MKEKSSFTLGLDIGHHTIKCVELLWAEGQFKLNQIDRVPLADSSKESAVSAVQQLFSKKTFSAKKLRVAISGPSLVIRRIQLPRLTYSELKGAIRYEAEGHIPFPIDDCLLDFQILDQTPDKKLMNVLLVAAKRDLVQERLQCVASLGLDVELVDVDVFCLINAFEMLADNPHEQGQGLLNMDYQGSSFVILQGKLPFYVKEISVGGKDITKALAQARQISEAEAEKMMFENTPERFKEIPLAVQQGLEPLAEELRRAIDYFENESGESLRSIGLSGSAAAFPEVSGVLSEELGRAVSLWDNKKKLPLSAGVDQEIFTKHSVEYNIALGLALRSVKGQK